MLANVPTWKSLNIKDREEILEWLEQYPVRTRFHHPQCSGVITAEGRTACSRAAGHKGLHLLLNYHPDRWDEHVPVLRGFYVDP